MKAPKALITGSSGFVGSYLAKKLASKGWAPTGLDISPSGGVFKLPLEICDVRDLESLVSIIRFSEPDFIIHLASMSHIPKSWENPKLTCEVNLMGVINLMESIRRIGIAPRVLLVGSFAEYGRSLNLSSPVTEDAPLRPMNPYATSKMAQDLISSQYFYEHSLDVIRVRPFMHTGPNQQEVFLIPHICKQVAQVILGFRQQVLIPKNHSPFDVTDVRDMANAYIFALEKGESGHVYNISSGNVTSIEQIMDTLSDISGRKFEILETEELGISDLCPNAVGSNVKFSTATGWAPKVPLSKTLKDTLDYWISVL